MRTPGHRAPLAGMALVVPSKKPLGSLKLMPSLFQRRIVEVGELEDHPLHEFLGGVGDDVGVEVAVQEMIWPP